MFPEEAVLACNSRLAELLLPYGVRFTDMLYCPHAPKDTCACRKPATGMWLELVRRHGLRAGECLMIGDKDDDMRFAARAGLAGRALTLTGKGRDKAALLDIEPSSQVRATAFPASMSHPHLIIPDFSRLEEGIDMLARQKAGA